MQRTQIKQTLRSWGSQEGSLKMAGRFYTVAGGCAVGSQHCLSRIWLHGTSCVADSSGCDYLHHHRRMTLLTGCYQRQCASMNSCLPRNPPFPQCAQRTSSSQSSILPCGECWQGVPWWITNSKLLVIWNSSWFEIVRACSDLGTILTISWKYNIFFVLVVMHRISKKETSMSTMEEAQTTYQTLR